MGEAKENNLAFIEVSIGNFLLKISRQHFDLIGTHSIYLCSQRGLIYPRCNYYHPTQKRLSITSIGRAIADMEGMVEFNNKEKVVLHKDGDYFNCLIDNLDVKPKCFSTFLGKPLENKTGFRGVHFDAKRNKYRASIYFMGERIRLGRYASESDAFEAYKNKAIELYGDYALRVLGL